MMRVILWFGCRYGIQLDRNDLGGLFFISLNPRGGVEDRRVHMEEDVQKGILVSMDEYEILIFSPIDQ
jgi:hypothetical protein